MDSINRILLDRIQRSFPVASDPYSALSEGLEISESEVLGRIVQLKRDKIIRQISAIFNTGALGYRTSLVAMAVPEDRLDIVAHTVNEYPGVSHNYLRPGDYNMWFTIAVPHGQDIETVVSELSVKSGRLRALVLPAIKKYKLAVVLDVLEEGDSDQPEEKMELPCTEADRSFRPTSSNIAVVKCIQEDLPLVSKPFAAWAESLGMKDSELLANISDWIGGGTIRRFAAVLNHRQVGFRANGMVVWNCPDEKIDRAGETLASYPEVSHCYNRLSHPQWPYNLYAMVHGRSPEECEIIAGKLSKAAGIGNFQILFSTKEYKKIRLKLFW